MPKLSQQNKQRLDAAKSKLLQKRAVLQPFDLDDFELSAVHRSVLRALVGDKIKVRTTARHVKQYLEENYKRDCTLKKEELILAKSDFSGRKDDNFYELLKIQSWTCTDKEGVQAKVAWRGTDTNGKKYKDSMIKLSMLNQEVVAQHKVEHEALAASMEKWSSKMAHFYTPINDGFLSK